MKQACYIPLSHVEIYIRSDKVGSDLLSYGICTLRQKDSHVEKRKKYIMYFEIKLNNECKGSLPVHLLWNYKSESLWDRLFSRSCNCFVTSPKICAESPVFRCFACRNLRNKYCANYSSCIENRIPIKRYVVSKLFQKTLEPNEARVLRKYSCCRLWRPEHLARGWGAEELKY